MVFPNEGLEDVPEQNLAPEPQQQEIQHEHQD